MVYGCFREEPPGVRCQRCDWQTPRDPVSVVLHVSARALFSFVPFWDLGANWRNRFDFQIRFLAMTLDPHKLHDDRVVSDMSRFEFGTMVPRNRSRNPTPTSSDYNPSNDHGFILHLNASEPYLPTDIYSDYMNASEVSADLNRDVPYPLSGTNSNPILAIPSVPNASRNSNDTLTDGVDYRNKDLPPILEPKDYYGLTQTSVMGSGTSDLQSTNSRKKELEQHLVKQVMNQPLVSIPASKFVGSRADSDKEITITLNLLLYVFEITCEMILIILSSTMLQKDNSTPNAIYRYFIASAAIAMIVSLLFICQVINFEKRNGSFYCLAATLLTIVSFIIAMSQLVSKLCPSSSVCDTRKAITAFIIISTFLWIGNLVMFLTTLYISKLNLLDDINFDYQEVGSNQSRISRIPPMPEPEELLLQKFILNEKGEMYPVQGQMNVDGRNKILVYTL